MAKYEGKKTVFEDSDDEEEKEQDEGMEEGGEEKKDVPEKAIKEGKKNRIFLYIFIVTRQL